jgi:hypothetical protein
MNSLATFLRLQRILAKDTVGLKQRGLYQEWTLFYSFLHFCD